MKGFRMYQAFAATALFAVSLTACGGGGGGGTPATGAATPGVSRGVIEDKGSVVVNGVKFEIAPTTTIRIDDNPGAETALERGMVVTVKGTFDDRTGTATEIEVDDNLQGPITNIDPIAKTITVMGKTVRFEDNVTRLNDDNPKTFLGAGGQPVFTAGQVVEVSGFDDSTGTVRASRIDDRTGTTEIEVKGFISGTPAVNSFSLAQTQGGPVAFTVNFTSASLPTGLTLAANLPVEVRGQLQPGTTTITARGEGRGVTFEDDGIDDNVAKVEVEGLVQSVSNNTFVVNGITVNAASARFENGVAGDLAVNVKVEAEGPIVNGIMQAVKVSFRSNVRLQGLVTANPGTGTLTVLGKTVATSANTDFRNITLGTITAGTSRVEVRGFLALNGDLVATRIDVTNSDREFIQAPVTAKAANSLTMLGLTITTRAGTEFRNVSDAPIGSAAFFDLVVIGPTTPQRTVVKARLDTGTLVADQLEIEGDR